MTPWLSAHRGPFRLCVCRPNPKKKVGFFTTEWLTGESPREDVEEEARGILGDPRDSVSSVSIWSVTESQFAGTFK